MKKSISLVIFVFLMMFPALSLYPLIANAGDNDCVLQASVDVIVQVWDADDQGNKGNTIWKGLIKQGEQKSIKSRYGQIRYSSTTVIDENEPLSGDYDRPCYDGLTIGVP
jgi:hypothetical protein